MSMVTGLLGVGGGAGGSGFDAPQEGVTVAKTREGAQQQLQQQQAFSQAANPYAIGAMGSQNALLNQLQAGANGEGPNPALAQLNQTTAQNVANQAALMASQRGASSNPGLMARQAARQGANTQQQAAGQAATMQAQQQQAYQQQLAQQQAQMVGQGQAALNASQNAANQIYSTASGLQGNMNQGNASLAQTNMQGGQGVIGGLMRMSGGAASAPGGANGGMAGRDFANYKYADGGEVLYSGPGAMSAGNATQQADQSGKEALYKGASSFGKYLHSAGDKSDPSDAFNASSSPNVSQIQPGMPGMQAPVQPFSGGGKVPAMVSAGERYLKPQDVEKVKKGANPMKVGEKIPGKPIVGGAKNSYANDVIPKDLDEGGIILPRSVTQSKNPEWAAHKFVKAHMAKGGLVPKLKGKK